MNNTTKKTLSPEEFYRCSVIMAQIQNACPHKHVDEWSFVIEGQRGYMRQCRDCLMYNPLTVKRFANNND